MKVLGQFGSWIFSISTGSEFHASTTSTYDLRFKPYPEHGIDGTSPFTLLKCGDIWWINIFACVQNPSDIPHIHQHSQTLKRYQITSTFHPSLPRKDGSSRVNVSNPRVASATTAQARPKPWGSFRPRKTREVSKIWIRYANSSWVSWCNIILWLLMIHTL